jgi:hypothetical protein
MFKGRVQFVIVDIDHSLSPAQKELKKKYFRGYIPHVVVLDRQDLHSRTALARPKSRYLWPSRQSAALTSGLRLTTRLQSTR